jgi:hypothetical protein
MVDDHGSAFFNITTDLNGKKLMFDFMEAGDIARLFAVIGLQCAKIAWPPSK